MGILGRLLQNKRAGAELVAWHRENLRGPETLGLRSDAFEDGATIPPAHAGRRAGGQNISPALDWNAAPAGTAQLLLIVEDPDAPTNSPFVHAVAIIDPAVTAVPAGALAAASPGAGVRLLRSTMRTGYLGPEPIKGHGPHRYVFQLFALAEPLPASIAGRDAAKAKPRAVMPAVTGPVLARGRLDGFYER
ncbi:YbhB/YbcL family Raf kinase inhibitor-like protein [Nocardia yunnanensis]|uniref:YbhB/YbcL family Raf kinase inhibitor-like protein n=1 Tax=Nocardia yunnanensis TaxID=2382165 RepID=A0A386ZB25_9NOCA|nr:YbhB/YbcL family Raf kinase inhibitor-like protein [Nocardia yunnanensis]AYF74778.1 YbhB/YbcL family Raf kinase inhibitor-like protein [Nocardia yunnanensis]